MTAATDRRSFLKTTAAGAAFAAGSYFVSETAAQETPSSANKLVVGIMGVNGRGSALASAFSGSPNCEVGYLCDVDERAIGKVLNPLAARQEIKPQGVGDFRRILDDKAIDALAIAAPNHWHAPATILACAAGKHVYVEKPLCHNPREGELAVEAARKMSRVVTMGTQRRTWPAIVEGIQKVHAGEIGTVRYARSWYNNRRPSIGHGKPAAPPAWLNWELWQGPAPDRPFLTRGESADGQDSIVHYNWHWRWHWGNGELGNNGVHALDVARWGMQVDYPIRVTSGGGKYRHDDDQETPDTHVVTYNFPGNKSIMWEGLSWSPLGPLASGFGVSFHGDEGSLLIDGAGYKIFDMRNKEIEAKPGQGGDSEHVANFLDCIRTNKRPNADVAEAHKSTLLCHLGNIAHRVNRVLTCSEKDGHIQGDDEAMALWSREYRPGWEPKV